MPDADLPSLLRPLADAPTRSALVLDFDGTLAGIVADPRDARPLPGVPELLARLAAAFALVAVVSGRPTEFLEEVLGSPDGVVLAGLYGLDRALRGPEREKWTHVIDDVVAEATAAAPPGVYVEPKGLTTTLHWRNAPEQKDWVVAFSQHEHETRGLAIHQGRHERELRPPVAVDKGTVVRSLADEYAGRLDAMAAFGDDKGDLPAFAALAALGGLERPDRRPLYTVRVAAVDDESPPEVAAHADLTVAGAAGAVALLRTLAEAAAAAADADADAPSPD